MRGTKRGGRLLLWFALLICAAIGAANMGILAASAAPKAIYGGEGGVALMFNVYQNTQEVGQIAQILDHYGVRGSFFLGGVWAEQNEDMVFDLYLAGHDIGNHGYSHKLPAKAGASVARGEIQRTDVILSEIIGQKPYLYAPPSGDFNQETVDIAAQEGYLTILWSADTIDWRDQDAKLIQQRALTRLKDGGLLLMHPTPATVQALPGIIEGLAAKGFAIKSVSELLGGSETKVIRSTYIVYN